MKETEQRQRIQPLSNNYMTRDSAPQLVILPLHYQEKKALESFKDAVPGKKQKPVCYFSLLLLHHHWVGQLGVPKSLDSRLELATTCLSFGQGGDQYCSFRDGLDGN